VRYKKMGDLKKNTKTSTINKLGRLPHNPAMAEVTNDINGTNCGHVKL
jgi:hypothetical protein